MPSNPSTSPQLNGSPISSTTFVFVLRPFGRRAYRTVLLPLLSAAFLYAGLRTYENERAVVQWMRSIAEGQDYYREHFVTDQDGDKVGEVTRGCAECHGGRTGIEDASCMSCHRMHERVSTRRAEGAVESHSPPAEAFDPCRGG